MQHEQVVSRLSRLKLASSSFVGLPRPKDIPLSLKCGEKGEEWEEEGCGEAKWIMRTTERMCRHCAKLDDDDVHLKMLDKTSARCITLV